MEEVWKTIEDFPNYEVSNQGRVRNMKTGNMLTVKIGRDGHYSSVFLCNNGHENTQRVHRLVAEAFLGKRPGMMVNHIDGDKLNNNVDNLEWCTAKENNIHAIKSGLNHPGAYQKRPIEVVETGEIFDGVCECANAVGGDFRNVYAALNGQRHTVNGLHFRYADKQNTTKTDKKSFLYPHQWDAVDKMFDGCILNGGVGSGKSRTGLYYYFKEYGGSREGDYVPMKNPADLYIITTAKKRNDLEWEDELRHYLLSLDESTSYYKNKVVVDSWQNIKKYIDVEDAFFIFDEDHVTGTGAWVKAFYKITKKNRWIILSASPGDKWEEYIPVFVANGFYRNKTEFNREHCVFSRFSKYPKIERYLNEGRLIRLRNKILIDMNFERHTVPIHDDVYCSYDISKYKDIVRNRWDPFKDAPIEQPSALCYTLRRVVNSDESRQVRLLELLETIPRAIIFYNFDYERDILLNLHYGEGVEVAEHSGHAHQPVPDSKKWVYLCQYNSACEGFNCIKTDTIIFFSQNYSYKTMIQAAGRIDRLNSPFKNLYYFHLKSRSGIDLAISKALSQKKKFNETRWVKW